MESLAVQILIASVIACVVWRTCNSSFAKGSLSHIPGPRRASWWKGNFSQFFNPEGWEFHKELYGKYGGVARLDMLFGDQTIYVSDPLALHHICVKDQDIYEEAKWFLTTFRVIFGPSVLSTAGDEHKRQRKLLNPVFSVKHIRELTSIFYPIAHKLCYILEKEAFKGEQHVDVYNWIHRVTLEYIGQGGLGYSFNALDSTQTNAYSEAMKAFAPLIFKLGFLLPFLPRMVQLGSPSLRRRIVEAVPSRTIKSLVTMTDIIEENSKEILREKREALRNGDEATHAQIGSGKDVMSVLLKTNSGANGDSDLPESELLAHMSTFITTGHETTAGAVGRILYILSQHQEVQDKLREEVATAREEHGDLDYEMLMGLPYLDAVICETMRVYPPVPHLDRVTQKDTVLPLLQPIESSNGKEIKEVHIKKNTTVYISILGANRSKVVWGEDAEEWNPERWLKPLPPSVEDARLPGVYSHMMTFIGGARACIGFKYAELEMKLTLSMLLDKFIFEPGPEVYWEMGHLQHPVIKGEDRNKTQVPLKVSLVRK